MPLLSGRPRPRQLLCARLVTRGYVVASVEYYVYIITLYEDTIRLLWYCGPFSTSRHIRNGSRPRSGFVCLEANSNSQPAWGSGDCLLTLASVYILVVCPSP